MSPLVIAKKKGLFTFICTCLEVKKEIGLYYILVFMNIYNRVLYIVKKIIKKEKIFTFCLVWLTLLITLWVFGVVQPSIGVNGSISNSIRGSLTICEGELKSFFDFDDFSFEDC